MTYGELLLPHTLIKLSSGPMEYADLLEALERGGWAGLDEDRLTPLIIKAGDSGFVTYGNGLLRATTKGMAYVQMMYNTLKFEFRND